MEADQLIADIARTTGLRLDKADPILVPAIIEPRVTGNRAETAEGQLMGWRCPCIALHRFWILAAAVINEVLLDQALVKLDRQVKVQADRVTAASTQAVLDAKKEAGALLTEAGRAVQRCL
jgi:hypothetical protein